MNHFMRRTVVSCGRKVVAPSSRTALGTSARYSNSALVQGMEKVNVILQNTIDNLVQQGTAKGPERIISGISDPANGHGPTYTLQGSDKRYLAFNSNSYMGQGKDRRLLDASHHAAEINGCGPGAVRFINGTNVLHIELEDKIAKFMGYTHGKVLVSAYTANLTVTSVIATKDTMIISDALNHNSIIKANDFSRVQSGNKCIYSHNNTVELEIQLKKALESGMKRVVVVTDGVFSMRGDVAPLDKIQQLVNEYHPKFEEGVIFVVDDSHGVAAFGSTGRGAIEVVNEKPNKVTHVKPDIVTLTFGKGFGVNGGAIVSDSAEFNRALREQGSPYIYTNPCGPAEIAACKVAIDIIDSPEGVKKLAFLQDRITQFRKGIGEIGIPTIDPVDNMPSHPVVPLIIGDAGKTHKMVKDLYEEGILTVGLTYPVVTKGEDELRIQINASHTEKDIDTLLAALRKVYKK